MEPHRLRRWRIELRTGKPVYFYTCARPGRSKGANNFVPDSMVQQWVRGLPPGNVAVVSLLGRKHGPEGLSEYSFYTFRSEYDDFSERKKRLTWQ